MTESSIDAAIPKKYAIEGSTGIFSFSCNESCPHHDFCIPDGIKIGDKYNILSIKEKIDCPIGNHMVRVIIKIKD